jgi:hypothetical protein
MVVFVGCEGIDCTPTAMEAKEGAVLNVANVAASSTLQASLTAEDAPLPAKTVEFYIEIGDDRDLVGEAETGSDGTATLDLKTQLDADIVREIAAVATGDGAFEANFDGDSTFCSSADEAPIRVLRA